MDSILMCGNTAVYNINTEDVYHSGLLPGYMAMRPCSDTFKAWLKLRYSSQTNTIARHLSGITFGQGKRFRVNEATHALSLSDSYWIKPAESNLRFEQISPYYAKFWTGIGNYDGSSIPTLYVGGYLNKEWINSNTLCKYGNGLEIEAECSRLCRACGIDAANVVEIENGIAVENITNAEFMLEQADQSGRIDPDGFTESEIEELFGLDGVQMLTIDAIIGNGDRHAGNFGWLRSTRTGEYVRMAPLYDFDHALDSTSEDDVIIRDLLSYFKNSRYEYDILRLCDRVIEVDTLDIFKKKARAIYNKMKE